MEILHSFDEETGSSGPSSHTWNIALELLQLRGFQREAIKQENNNGEDILRHIDLFRTHFGCNVHSRGRPHESKGNPKRKGQDEKILRQTNPKHETKKERRKREKVRRQKC